MGFTIKGASATENFLGSNFDNAKEPKPNSEILMCCSKTYVKRMMDNFKNTFFFEPSKEHTAMPTNYKPEFNITDIYIMMLRRLNTGNVLVRCNGP